MPKLAERTKVIGKSKIAESLKLMEQDSSYISLGVGEPDFPAPKNVIEAAKRKLDEGYTHYSPLQGKKELREALAKKLKKDNKIDANPEEIIITCGSKEAVLLTMATVADKGDEIIVPDPGYIAYRPIASMLDCVPLSLHLREDDKFEIHPERLEKLIGAKTKLLVINTPSNPTGTVFSKRILEEIADIVVDKKLMVLCDEAYEKLVYDDAKHISLASLNGMKEFVITLQTFSKTYAMCGFRVGYAVATENVIEEMKEFKVCTTIAAPTAFQLAAVEALEKSGKYVEEMRKEYDRRRKMFIKKLNQLPNISCVEPKGAFYAFPNITDLGMTSDEVSDLFLKQAKVITVPGTEFGKYGEGYLRMSYATSFEKLEEAVNRIEKVVSKL